ncbi:hypothetical protein T02_12213 [Trichinella nativa]|uniref:Uncharacterized protein n=1 Tax=Trichinella nativa TaxID=6335 RepID=A0A0V1L2H3_9BILA|nr:hypothetical protein T02_12213 [Trichinella nativa]
MEKIAIYKKVIFKDAVSQNDFIIHILMVTDEEFRQAGIFEFSHLSDWNEKQDSTFYNQCLISLCCYVLFSVTFALRRQRRRRRRQVRIQYQELRNSHSNNYTTCRRHVWKSQDN